MTGSTRSEHGTATEVGPGSTDGGGRSQIPDAEVTSETTVVPSWRRAVSRARRRWENVRLASIFLVLAALAGVGFALLNPPLQAFDEGQHFERAYQLSTGDLFSDKVRVRAPDGQIQHGYGGNLPEHMVKVIDATGTGNDEATSSYRYGLIGDLWTSPPRGKRLVGVRFDNTALYSPFAYAPEIAGIWIARSVGVPDIGDVYAARLAELAGWLLLMWAAIRIAPAGRAIFLVLALNPLAVWQAATLSPDAMGAALLALSVAILLRIRLAPVTSRLLARALLVTLALAVLAASTIKVSYLPMAALLLFVPAELWRRPSRWIVTAATTAVAAAWHIAVLPASAGVPQFHNLNQGVVDSHQQIEFILHHIPQFLGIMIWNVFGSNSVFWGDDYVSQLSWTFLPRWVPYVWIALFVYAIGMRRPAWVADGLRRSKAAMGGMIAIAVVSALMVVGALYVGWTYVGQSTVMGIQRRYWIPLTFLAVPLLLVVRPYFDGRHKNSILAAGSSVLLGVAVLSLYLNYQGLTI